MVWPFSSLGRIPTSFNIIDTGFLVDYVGLLNILPCVIPLLKDRASVLYTSTQVGTSQAEPNLLARLICGDVGIMSTLLGIAPTPYITCTTTRFYHVDSPAFASMHSLEINRVRLFNCKSRTLGSALQPVRNGGIFLQCVIIAKCFLTYSSVTEHPPPKMLNTLYSSINYRATRDEVLLCWSHSS